MKDYHEILQHLPKHNGASINILQAAKTIEAVLSKAGITANGTDYINSFLSYGVRAAYRKELLGLNVLVLTSIEYLDSDIWRISMATQSFGFEIRKDMFDAFERKLLNEYGVRVCLMPANRIAKGSNKTEVEVYSLVQSDERISEEELSSHIQLVQGFMEDIISIAVGNWSSEIDCAKWSVIDKTVDIRLLESDDKGPWFDLEVHWARGDSDDPIYEINANMSYDERIDNTSGSAERTEEKSNLKYCR